jgi:hypothetical protein
MGSALWAEWIIGRFTDSSRAASIVGDLLETAAQQGTLWFCLSVATVVLSLIWRRATAFVAAVYVAQFSITGFRALVFGIHAVHRPHDPWEPLLFSLAVFAAVLWTAAVYAAIRYGPRDKFAQLALGFCVLITMAILYWWIPIVTVTCMALAFSILVASVFSAPWRRALVVLAVALAFGFAGVRLSWYLHWVSEVYIYTYPQTHYVEVCTELFAVWTMTTACAWTHHLLLRRDQRNPEFESPT